MDGCDCTRLHQDSTLSPLPTPYRSPDTSCTLLNQDSEPANVDLIHEAFDGRHAGPDADGMPSLISRCLRRLPPVWWMEDVDKRPVGLLEKQLAGFPVEKPELVEPELTS